MQISLPLANIKAIHILHELLADKNVIWLVGGSCGLLLQGVEIAQPPRDLDLYVDADGVATLHEALLEFATDQPVRSKTGRYASLLSHYQIADAAIELVGEFEVFAEQSYYKVEVADFLSRFGVSYKLMEIQLGLMPLAHELVFNMMRQRADRYLAIAEKMKQNPNEHLMTLNKILERNKFSPDFIKQLNRLL